MARGGTIRRARTLACAALHYGLFSSPFTEFCGHAADDRSQTKTCEQQTNDRLVANEARLLQQPSTTNSDPAGFLDFYRKLFTKHRLDSGRSECFPFLTSAIFTCCQSYVIFFQSTARSTSISFSVFFSHLPNHTPKNPGHPILAVSIRAASSFPPVPVVPTLNPARRRDAKEATGDLSANRAEFQVLVGASMPDSAGVSSENIDARYDSEWPEVSLFNI
ncbi:hypothetical protein BSFP_034880 [Burkholderia stabilis]|uniref:Uncharacterized protein n=1 Tax=Burkholderia stabilis TaxID=95485 RepID=A0A1Y1BSV9_9BURK|nr:hypothetical protein BSFP_034880 [Burkholderia stabilis]